MATAMRRRELTRNHRGVYASEVESSRARFCFGIMGLATDTVTVPLGCYARVSTGVKRYTNRKRSYLSALFRPFKRVCTSKVCLFSPLFVHRKNTFTQP